MNPALWMPLTLAATGKTVLVRRVRAGSGLTARLAAMGLFPGTKVCVCKNDHNGPVILGINGTRVMLGRGMADKLAVEDDVSSRPV